MNQFNSYRLKSLDILRGFGLFILVVLGILRDGSFVNESGVVEFPSWYPHTWVLSSMSFVVIVLMGLFAGDYLKNSTAKDCRKVVGLAFAGLIMAAAGWTWSIQMPVIKAIWSSSMVLISSGYCFLYSLCTL